MILLCGIPSETPLAMVRAQLDKLGVPYVLFNQRRFAAMTLAFELSTGQVTGWLQVEGRNYRLEEFGGVYTRLMDDQRLPELCDAPAEAQGSLPRRFTPRPLTTATRSGREAIHHCTPSGSPMSSPSAA